MSIDTDAMQEIEEAANATTTPVCEQAIAEPTEEEKLAAFRRQLRAESLKAALDMNWCQSGTNERFQRLGLRLIGEGVGVRVKVTVEREMVLLADADTYEEAAAILATGDTSILVQYGQKDFMPGWNTLKAELTGKVWDPTVTYKIGDADPTLNNPAVRKALTPPGDYLQACEKYNSRHGYCSLPKGHEGRQHIVGNGTVIHSLWTARRPAGGGRED